MLAGQGPMLHVFTVPDQPEQVPWVLDPVCRGDCGPSPFCSSGLWTSLILVIWPAGPDQFDISELGYKLTFVLSVFNA